MTAPRKARIRGREAKVSDGPPDGAGLGTLDLVSASELARLVRQAIDLVDSGKVEEAHALLAPHLDKDGGLGPAGARAALLIEGARILVRLGRHDEALTRARRGLALAEVDGDSRLAAEALIRLGLVELRRGDLRAARVSYEEARSRYRRLRAEDRVAAAENNLGLVCTGLGEWDAARAHFAEAIAITRRHGNAEVLGYRLKNLGVLETKMGAWDRAKATLEEARDCFDRADDRRHRATIALALGHLARLTRRFEDAAQLLGEGLAQALAQRQLREEAVAREFLGDLALDRGDVRQAWQGYRAALAVADRLKPALDLEVEILHRLARVQVMTGDPAGAAKSLARARAASDKLCDPYESARIAIASAELALAVGRPHEAPRALESAVDTLTRLGERIERAHALELWATRVKDPAEARRLLYRAAACCHEAGAAHELARIEAALGAPAEAKAIAVAAGCDEAMGTPLAGKSRALVRVREAVQRAARSNLPVLVEGPPGTGKDLVARTIHLRSRRASGPYVTVRCTQLPPERALLDLVGDARRPGAPPGLIAQAEGGTLVLDDVGSLAPAAQAALARLVSGGEYLCPGELSPRVADVRVIALAPEPLGERVVAARFRADLKDALAGIAIELPPLRERTPDILPLARAFLRTYGGPDAPRIDDGAAERLIAHGWPGNARELELVIQGALIQTPAGARALDAVAVTSSIEACGKTQEKDDAQPAQAEEATEMALALPSGGSDELRARLVEAERRELLSAIERAHGNKSRAARLLKVSRKTLYARLHRHGLATEEEAS